MINRELRISIRATVVTLVLTGLAYPLATTGLALLLFPARARGSLIADQYGRTVGSELIAQSFASAGYLQPRPSNLGPTSKALRDRAATELQRLVAENPDATGPLPAELVTASGSGLDPHVSPEAALWQAPRMARARGVSEERVRAVIEANVEGRELLVLGEPRVNVLLVNLALDWQFGRPPLAHR